MCCVLTNVMLGLLPVVGRFGESVPILVTNPALPGVEFWQFEVIRRRNMAKLVSHGDVIASIVN